MHSKVTSDRRQQTTKQREKNSNVAKHDAYIWSELKTRVVIVWLKEVKKKIDPNRTCIHLVPFYFIDGDCSILVIVTFRPNTIVELCVRWTVDSYSCFPFKYYYSKLCYYIQRLDEVECLCMDHDFNLLKSYSLHSSKIYTFSYIYRSLMTFNSLLFCLRLVWVHFHAFYSLHDH